MKYKTMVFLFFLVAVLFFWRADAHELYRIAIKPSLPDSVSYEEIVEDSHEETLIQSGDTTVDVIVIVNEPLVAAIRPVATENVETKIVESTLPEFINLAVPFTPQAPHGDWDMPYQEACEEASIYMVAQYYAGEKEGLIDSNEADTAIVSIGELTKSLGLSQDVTIAELAIVAQAGWNFKTKQIENPTVEEIKNELVAGRPVIAPMAGRLLGNPYFTAPGPVYHMLVIRGYTNNYQFIVNDPGTYRGEEYLYNFDIIMNAMHDWNGGGEITNGKKTVLVIMPII